MFSGIIEVAGGALIVLGIFAAFMTWAVFPLLPFLLLGAVYGLVRYGVPAAGRAALVVEQSTLAAVRWVLQPVAHWALQEAPVRAGRG